MDGRCSVLSTIIERSAGELSCSAFNIMKNISRKTKISCVSYLLIIVSFFVIFSIPTSKATVSDEDLKDLISTCRTILEGPYDVINKTLNGTGLYGDVYMDALGSGTRDTAADKAAQQQAANNGGGTVVTAPRDNLAGTLKTLDGVLAGVSIMWAILVATTRIFTELEKGRDTLEVIVKYFIEISVVALLLLNTSDLLNGINGIGKDLVTTFSSSALISGSTTEETKGNGPATSEEIEKIEKEKDKKAEELLLGVAGLSTREDIPDGMFTFMFWELKMNITLMLPKLASSLVRIVSTFVVLQILIEIQIRRVLAPLALGDIYAEGVRSPGARYLKKYLASILKIGMCLVICAIASRVTTTAMTYTSAGAMERIFAIIASEFVAISLMFKAETFTNDAVGV